MRFERPSLVESMGLLPLPERRAARTIFEMNYYPTRFPDRASPLRDVHGRSERLHLPFSSQQFDGVVFADELR